MASALPLGDPAPTDGLLPSSAAAEVIANMALPASPRGNFSLYIHVPFCRTRCGYCDFNTYTSEELRGVRQSDYAQLVIRELDFAAKALDASGIPHRQAATVFIGGGTPTALPVADIAQMLAGARAAFGVAPGAEVTVEANPDSVSQASLTDLAEAGVTRVSFGMQSAVPHVLAVLERTHNPERIPLVVDWAHRAGLDVSLDLIFGTPGESLADWRNSLEAAVACEVGHLSTYALIVEPGTRLARQIARGEYPASDDDLSADMYELADQFLGRAGYEWYELSNWSRGLGQRSRHNLAYWQGADWWGAGPGAHSHVGGVRWWNVKHPAPYAERILRRQSPAAAREILGDDARYLERIMLGLRLAEGLPRNELSPQGRLELASLIADGLVDPSCAIRGLVSLTLRGRLLADGVTRRLSR